MLSQLNPHFLVELALLMISSTILSFGTSGKVNALNFYNEVDSPADSSGLDIQSVGSGFDGFQGFLWADKGSDPGFVNSEGYTNDPIDTYLFAWGGGEFKVSSASSHLKSKLSLFKGVSGKGLKTSMNSQDYSSGKLEYKSEINIGDLAAGWYRLSISGRQFNPFNGSGQRIFDRGSKEPTSVDTVLAGWSWTNQRPGEIDGNYKIQIHNGQTTDNDSVPEPMTVLGTLLAGGYGLYRKRKNLKPKASSKEGT